MIAIMLDSWFKNLNVVKNYVGQGNVMACLRMLYSAKLFIELRFNTPTSYLISKNELPNMKLGLMISNYEISMWTLLYITDMHI
jgi:hypothetical protein